MAKVLNFESEIANGLTIEPEHVKQSVDAFTGAEAYDITISGSLVTTGSIKGTTTLTIGSSHTNTGTLSTIAGGNSNTTSGTCSFIGGGNNNIVEDNNDSILGGSNNSIINSIYVSGCIGHNSIIGGNNNKIDCTRGYNFIAGGYGNIISGSVCGFHNYANVILGRGSLIDACDRNSITGGGGSIISGSISNSNIAGGVSHYITGQTSTIGGGARNCVLGPQSTIAGGLDNMITNSNSAIGGGTLNTIESTRSGILGGISNCIIHSNSFAIGSNLTSTAACTTFVNNLCNVGGGTSDCRLKENIQNIPYGLSHITQLNPVSYSFITDESNKTKYGLLAQCVQEVMPELIYHHPTDTIGGDPVLQFDKEAIWASMINAIKELKQEIEELKLEINTLKNK